MNKTLRYSKKGHKKKKKEEKDYIWELFCCVRFVRNEQISERAEWERSHNFSLSKSRSWLTVSKAFMKFSAMMKVRRQLSKLRSTTSEMWSNSVVVLWDRRKSGLTGGKDIIIEDKSIKLWEADIFKQLWEERGKRDKVKRWRRRGVISFRNRKNNWVFPGGEKDTVRKGEI